MNNVIKQEKMDSVESALIQNDLSKLSTQERISYYKKFCESVGLNPLTQPLDYILLNGKLRLYAKRDATDQLRKIHSVSLTVTSREKFDDIYVVTVRAVDKSGRVDESTGAVNIAGQKGDMLANSYMKAETKAKRRATLSICGLGLLDEMEVETVPGAAIPEEKKIEPQVISKNKITKKSVEVESPYVIKKREEVVEMAKEVFRDCGPEEKSEIITEIGFATYGEINKSTDIEKLSKAHSVLKKILDENKRKQRNQEYTVDTIPF
jgi:hypothetical protein